MQCADEPQYPNTHYLGHVNNMHDVYARSTVLVRLPETDGAPNMPIEMLAHGRYVIYRFPHVGCQIANNLESLRACIASLTHVTTPNYEGAITVTNMFSLENEAAKFRQLVLDNILETD